MYLTRVSALRVPGKAIVIVLILMGLFQTSLGFVGTSDSAIFYFGDNSDGQNGINNATETDRMMDEIDVSLLRSISCGSQTTVLLFYNNTLVSQGNNPNHWSFGTSYAEISSVSSISASIMYSLTSNTSTYAQGSNFNRILLNDTVSSITEPTLSPPRLNEDVRYCITSTCLAFSHFPPGSITDVPVIHEPDTPLYKFIGAWGDLKYGHLGIAPPPQQPTPGMYYEGPDLIVKMARMSVHYSIFVLHNDTLLVSGGQITLPRNGLAYVYERVVYHPSVNASQVKIVDASASYYHVLLLSEDHRLFYFGWNYYYASGIPGLQYSNTVSTVREVPFDGILYQDDYIVQIRAQISRSSVITKMGYVYIWGSQWTVGGLAQGILYIPTLESTFLQDRFAIGYLDQDDITKTTHDAYGSCILTLPRHGNCPGEPPSVDFYCSGGAWRTREGESNLETLTVSSPITIDGNLTISGPLVIHPQSSISVTGCLSIGSIEIFKQQGDDSPSQDIISTDTHCPDISSTTVSVIPTGKVKKCQKKTASLSKSETGGRSAYSAIFKVNDNDCKNNYWWIILVSVLGGVVLIVVIAIIVYLPRWRKKHSI